MIDNRFRRRECAENELKRINNRFQRSDVPCCEQNEASVSSRDMRHKNGRLNKEQLMPSVPRQKMRLCFKSWCRIVGAIIDRPNAKIAPHPPA